MQDIQKKVYHKNRFYVAKSTPKEQVENSKFNGIKKVVEARVKILRSYVELDNLVIYVNKNDMLETLQILKDSSYDILSEMSAIHLNDDSFELFYQLLSMDRISRIRVKTNTKDCIDSVCEIFRNALWSEREAYDMFGIKFNKHPYLKRILMPDDWSGHPLRKDYPLKGDEKAQWYEVDKIFGEEYRETIGKEQRDSSFIDPKDTFNFSHLGFEVSKGEEPRTTPKEIKYNEDGGIFLVTKFDKQKQLDKRR